MDEIATQFSRRASISNMPVTWESYQEGQQLWNKPSVSLGGKQAACAAEAPEKRPRFFEVMKKIESEFQTLDIE